MARPCARSRGLIVQYDHIFAMILFEKFGQHQPLNRQAERYAREGVPISLSTMADAVGSACAALAPLNESNGLRAPSSLMVDKITTVPKSKVGARVGKLDDEDALRLNQAILVFLGLAVSPKAKQG